jgi:recombination protein RecT
MNIKDLKPKTKEELAAMRPRDQIAHLLQAKSGELAKLIPKHLSLERLLKVATIAATTTPALAKCDVPSLVAAIGQCAQLGLEPNTVLGHAYLVPFNTKRKGSDGVDKWVNSVQVIIGYRGLIDLARRSGQIISLAAHEVCENDLFEYEYGLIEKLRHVPARADRGKVIGFYAVAHLKDGGHAFEFMSVEQVEEIREASQGWQQAVKYQKTGSHPWKKHFIEMGRKSAIRRIAKYLPLSIEAQTAIEADGARVDLAALSDPNTVEGEVSWLPDDDAGETDDPFGVGQEPTPTPAPASDGGAAPALENAPSETIEQTTKATTAREYQRAKGN